MGATTSTRNLYSLNHILARDSTEFNQYITLIQRFELEVKKKNKMDIKKKITKRKEGSTVNFKKLKNLGTEESSNTTHFWLPKT